ncbi:hypothetical protein IY145_17860 [Methylosinus sp. H3A]|uniref:hypothetical protein n=1 Tax=Methylosinus sp. H3A TaxID=2785786 RepID=UPI0018C30D65|nr:hypothetical protein [Methylosinus sp. H3A]MBG0811224.1 hypothetical protein [Methylosinus sp. H3A]
MVAIADIAMMEMEGEARARDLDIAERLGFERPRDIRKLIERNIAELQRYGAARHRGALLNRPQGGTVGSPGILAQRAPGALDRDALGCGTGAGRPRNASPVGRRGTSHVAPIAPHSAAVLRVTIRAHAFGRQ